MSNIVKDFNYSRKLCNGCKSQAEITHGFANFRVYLLKESTGSKQDLDK